MPSLPKTALKFSISLLKHQAKLWLGEEAAGIAAGTFIEEDLQKNLEGWLDSEDTEKQLLNAVQKAQLYLQDKRNCPDADLRYLFRDLTFGDLPAVQEALRSLPKELDDGALMHALEIAFQRDVPRLTEKQCQEGARLYTDAMLREVGKLKSHFEQVLLHTVLDLKKGQHGQDEKLARILHLLENKPQAQPPSPTLPGDLPPGSHLPFPRNAIFTGRVEDLEKLAGSLLGGTDAGAVINQTITGMGGLGKTQLAVEFAYRHGHQFKGVHWMDLREVQNIDSQIALCGSQMSLPNFPPTLQEQVIATIHEWKTNGPRLLILDNFEEYNAANDILGDLHHSHLKVLITSRHTNWNIGLGLKRLPLGEFSPAESLEFLRKYIPPERENDPDLERLAEHLGYLPLALELAGRYLDKQPRLKVQDYLAQIQKALDHRSMQNWKVEQKSLTGHDLSLAQTFAQSWNWVTDETARKLFITLGYCAPNTPIPQAILDAAPGDAAGACDEALSELTGLGLLKEGPVIHPLLAEFARGLDAENLALKPFSEALANLASSTNQSADKAGNYTLFTPLLSHLRTVAGSAEMANLEPAGQLWNSIGYHISDLADFAGAKAAYERAIKIWETAFGAEHPQVATGVNNLGGVLKALGDHAGAKAAYERALKIFEKFLPPGHPYIKTVRGNLEGL